MAVILREWLELIEKEYIREFIVSGGAAIKFVVADPTNISLLSDGLANQASTYGLVFTTINSARVKLHMIHDVFFAVSRLIDWETDAQLFVEMLFKRKAYQWPSPGEPVALTELAEANKVDPIILRREFNQWMNAELMKDTSMAQDFRIAVTQLCINRLGPAGHGGDDIAPILQWLRGELKVLSPLKSANIYAKITRHNARAMLRSLCRWLALAGHKGLILVIDIRQLARTASLVTEGVRYTSGAVMDAYEVLRQLVDDADLFERLFVAVVANDEFIGGDHKRSVDAYTALKMRIWDDVRARTRDNPLAPMVVMTHEH